MRVAPEDVEVRSAPRQGFSVAEASGYLVAVTTELDTMLEQEGYARELVRRIQQLRKDADLAISDRIVTYIAATRRWCTRCWRTLATMYARKP